VALVVLVTLAVVIAANKGLVNPVPTPTIEQPTTAPLPTMLPAAVSTRVSEKDGMVMVYVPAGEFLMGSTDSDAQANDNEKPQHTVSLDTFWIDRTEVTRAQYKKCVQAGACQAPYYDSDFAASEATRPVEGISWQAAAAYCQWVGRQLPTEAQWEKAARGTDGRIYPWGNQRATCEYAVMDDGSGNGCGKSNTWPVGSKPRGVSPYGALDMAGNTGEWVADWYDDKYYVDSPPQNPQGPPSGQLRVYRSGLYYSEATAIRASVRGSSVPDGRESNLGFRCALAPGEAVSLTPTAVLTKTALPTLTDTPVPATPTMTPTAAPGIGSARISDKDSMVMVYVPAGEFLMGSANSDPQAIGSEKPQHTIYLDAFWVDRTEVTNVQYNKCAQAGPCRASSYANDSSYNADNQPVVGVDWNDAQTYCQWAGRQLPTEAQWEKAARGTDGRIYPWGNQTATCDYAVMSEGGFGCGKGSVAWSVGSKPKSASPYGAVDMAGNVCEWAADWYDRGYYASSPPKNPQGPSSPGDYHVLRGGSWGSTAVYARAAYRDLVGVPIRRTNYIGFRCVAAEPRE